MQLLVPVAINACTCTCRPVACLSWAVDAWIVVYVAVWSVTASLGRCEAWTSQLPCSWLLLWTLLLMYMMAASDWFHGFLGAAVATVVARGCANKTVTKVSYVTIDWMREQVQMRAAARSSMRAWVAVQCPSLLGVLAF
jgi:hypothetical protein